MPATDTFTDSGTVLLPEHVRVPDLSAIRTVTEADLATWTAAAHAAILWGPDQRNGCTRSTSNGTYQWVNANHHLQSPDPFTPAHAGPNWADWTANADGRDVDQPVRISRRDLCWDNRTHPHTPRHQPLRPGLLSPDGPDLWSWEGELATPGLTGLLNTAWTSVDLTDGQAEALLDRARRIRQPRRLPVAPATWVTHVLTANPSPNLTRALRAWLALTNL